MVNSLTQARIVDRLAAAGFVGHANVDSLASYVDLMVKWNRKTNLTALALEPPSDEAIDRLIVEPVVASSLLLNSDAATVDLGSGGGSPAIPLRIQLPSLRMRMVESRSMKCAFIREAIRKLELSNTSVEESRFELLPGLANLKKSADAITIRAVRIDADLVDLMKFLLKPGGYIYRFASQTESAVPASLRIDSSVPLVGSLSSLFQTIRIAD